MSEQQMKKNIAWNTFGSVLYSACQWLITVLVVHISSYEAAGYLSIAMTTSSSFSAISLFSMRNYQVSDVKGEYSKDVYVGSRITTCIVALACCVISSAIGNSVYQMLCVDAFMLVRVAEAMVDVLHGENQKFQRYDYIGKSYLIRGVLTIVSFVLGLILTDNLMITLFFMALCNLVVAFIYDWRKTTSLEHISPIIWNNQVFNLLRKCAPIVVFSFLLSLENLIPKYILQQVEGPTPLGVYSTIASPTLIVQVFASVAFNPLLPGFSSVYLERDYNRFLKMLHKVYAGFILLSIIVTVGAIILGRWGLTLLFGKKILTSYELFLPIVWVTILTAIIWIFSSIIVAMRKIWWLLIGMIIDFAIMLPLARPIIINHGSNGISIVQIILYTLYITYMVIISEVLIRRDKNGRSRR